MVRLTLFHNGRKHAEPLEVHSTTTVSALRTLVSAHLSLPSHTLRLLTSGQSLTDDAQPLSATPLSSGGKLYVLASPAATVESVRRSRPDPLVRPFGRSTPRYVGAPLPTRPPPATDAAGQTYGFARVEALPGFADRDRATAILENLASDVGFLSVMRRKRWRVGALKEMPPDGRVGVDPVCVLGYNTGNGMEIHLRLRTDDMQGFRPMEKIRQVLAHELAHNEISEHDNSFKELMRWIEKEADKADWRRSTGRALAPGWTAAAVEGLDPLAERPRPLTSLSVVRTLGSANSAGQGSYRSSMMDALTAPKGEAEQEAATSYGARPSQVSLAEKASMHPPTEGEHEADVEMQPNQEESSEETKTPITPSGTSRERDPMLVDASSAPTETAQSSSEQTAPPLASSKRNPAVEQLTALGFSRGLATLALRENGRDGSRAADWLLSLCTSPSQMGSGGENAPETQSARAALQGLCGSGLSQDQLISALDAVHLYLSNALRNPGVERYVRINAANAAFRRRVGVHTHATALLQAAGFRLEDGVWRYKSMDSAPLWVTKSIVQDKLVEELRR